LIEMYFKDDKQISLFEFGQNAGLKLDPENRWVKKSELINWDKIEDKYAYLYCDNNGARAKLIRTALAALIIKQEEGFSDEATTQHIQENPYMQYFCGIKEFSLDKPFVPSLMVEFRKRFNEEIIREINDMMFKPEPLQKTENKDDNTPEPPNNGTLILDATCTPADITYPQDINLCNEAREKTEEMVETMHKGNIGKHEKPRLDKQKARREYLKTAKGKNRTKKVIRKAIKRQLSYIRRNLGYIKTLISQGNYEFLTDKQKVELEVIKKLYEQQKYMIDNRTNSVENRIVSISQSYVRPIVRGKATAKVEFGAKVAISIIGGYSFVDHLSWDAYNESEDLIAVIKKYRQTYGCYPEAVMVDKLYRNQKNIVFCNSRGIRISGPKLGRPKKDEVIDKAQEYKDSGIRNAVEGKFGEGKTSYGLNRIKAKLKGTSETVINLVFWVMNLNKRLRLLLHFFCLKIGFLKKWAF
jgi:IS5 family transposase